MEVSGRQRLGALILIMGAVAAAVGGASATLLYRRSLAQHRGRLVELAQSQARLIEAVVRFDADHSIDDHPDGPAAAALAQIEDAHGEYIGFGQTGEFDLARREGDWIVFLLAHRGASSPSLEPVPFDSDWAEPMRQALLGNSGTLVGRDYRGEIVLAAHEPVRGTNWGIVAKIDLAEIHAPFAATAVQIGLVAFAAAVAGALLFLRITTPLFTKLQASEQKYSAVVKESPDPIITIDRSGKLQSANPAAELILGYPERELIGRQFTKIGVLGRTSVAKAESEFALLLAGEDRLPFELTLTSPGDMPVTVEVNSRPIRERGKVVGVHAILRNITGRKLMEEALRESERELAIRNAVAQVCLTIPDDDMYGEVLGIILEATQSRFGVFGYVEEDGALVVPSMPRRVREAYHIPDEKIVLPRREWGDRFWAEAIQRREALHSNEPSPPTPLARVGLQRNITVPIVYQGQVAGLLQVANKEAGYEYRDFRLLEMVASAVAPILRTRLEKASQERKRKRAEEALRLTQFAVDHAGDALYWVGSDARFVYVNEAACRALGYSRQELLSMVVHDVDPDYPRETWADHWGQVKQRGSVTFESHHRTKGGEALPVELMVNHIEYDGEEYHCAFARDITERKRAEEALRRQTDLLNNIISNVPYSVFWKDRESVYLGCNENFAREAGIASHQDIIGKTDYDLAWKKEEADWYRQCDREVMERGEPLLNIEEPQLRADGTQATVLTSKVPLRDAEGQVSGILGIYADITERKRIEEALRESEEKFRTIAASAHDAVIVMDNDGKISHWNDAAEAIFGYTRSEAVGQYLHTFLAPERFHEDHFRAFPRFRETGQGAAVGRTLELAAVRKSGEEFPIELSMSAVTIRGKWESIGIVRDITERKQAEKNRIHRLQIEQERNHLRDAVRAFERVLGVVGHELRTPLAAIRAMAELLLQDDARQTAETDSFLHGIHDEIVRMSGLVNDILDVARLSSGTAPWNWSVVRVADACQAAIDSVSPLVDREGVQLSLDVRPPDLELTGDGSAVRRLVLNLLHNAHKHTSQGSIGVQARRVSKDPHEWVELKVCDTGEGMAPEITGRLGVAFALNSGVVGESHVKGSGLGLAICRGIAAAHGGTISMETARGVGTAATVLLRADLPKPAPVENAADIVCEALQ